MTHRTSSIRDSHYANDQSGQYEQLDLLISINETSGGGLFTQPVNDLSATLALDSTTQAALSQLQSNIDSIAQAPALTKGITNPDLASKPQTGPITSSESAVSATTIWASEGPSSEINALGTVLPNLQTNGAIQAIAVNPTNPNIMYVATVNGGIWQTTNATAATPHWVPLTDTLPSLSMGALAFDPTDATHQTLIAGIGAASSFSALHNTLSGVLRTTDGGVTWSQLGTAALAGDSITSVAARGTTLLAAADGTWLDAHWAPSGSKANGLFRSTDTGTTWTNISDGTHGLPSNISVSDLVGDPLNLNVFYAGVTGASGGVFKSTDGGLTWANISDGIGIVTSATDKILLAVHDDGANLAVFATADNGGVLSGVFRSLNSGSFVALDVPSGGVQGNVHASIAAEPTNPNIVYVGYGGGEANYLTRIDASKAAGSQITDISGGTFGSPHVDTRDMQIDANGNLILSTDGGLFSLPTPTANTGAWKAIGGDISDFELHDIAYDHVSKIIVAGSQDIGTLSQLTPGGTNWTTFNGGDGGDVAIDDVSLAGVNESIRYVSAQYLSGWQRQVYDSANRLVSATSLDDITQLGNDGQFVTPVELNSVDPMRILVGGSAHIYMSSNQGTSLTAIDNAGVNSGGGTISGGGMMVYGGYQNGVADPDLIYAASGANVLKQTAAGGSFTSTAPGGGYIVGVTDNPNNWATVFAIDINHVFESTNAGGTWVDVTHNLTSISGAATFYSIEYVPGTLDDALVVGTSSGVFDAHVSGLGGAAAWSQFGANLPDVIVHDLQYDTHDNVLVAATLGRGAWLVNNVTADLGIVGTLHTPPVVNVQNVSVAENASIAVSSLINSVSNPSGDTLTQYAFWDGGSGDGHFTLNGVIQPDGQWIYVNANNLGSIQYVGGPMPGSETLYVDVLDGTTSTWSAPSSLIATTLFPSATFPFSSDLLSQVEALYVGYYTRAGDPAGVNFWVGGLTNGSNTLQSEAAWFSLAAESQVQYPFLAHPLTATPLEISSFITSVYQDLFNRAPDAPGLNFWTNTLVQSLGDAQAVGSFILNVIHGAQNSDQTTIANKVTVAEWLTLAFAAAGSFDNTLAHALIASVTADPATVVAAEQHQISAPAVAVVGQPTTDLLSNSVHV